MITEEHMVSYYTAQQQAGREQNRESPLRLVKTFPPINEISGDSHVLTTAHAVLHNSRI